MWHLKTQDISLEALNIPEEVICSHREEQSERKASLDQCFFLMPQKYQDN